jgi:hypothetical protein
MPPLAPLSQTSKLVTLSPVFLSLFFLFAGIEKQKEKRKEFLSPSSELFAGRRTRRGGNPTHERGLHLA